MIRVGVRISVHDLSVFHGCMRDGRLQRRAVGRGLERAAAAHRVAHHGQPAGVDPGAHRASLGDVVERGQQLGAAAGRLVVPRFVSMVMTTKPCDAMRGPSQAMLDCPAVKPGEMATAPNVPSDVVVG